MNFIRDVKDALNSAASHLKAAGLEITQVDLDLQTTVTKEVGGEISLKIISLDVNRDEEAIDTISLTLVPEPAPTLMNLIELSDDLCDAIDAIARASLEASSTRPAMTLKSATVALSVGMTTGGNVKVLVKGARSRANSHTLRISLTPIPTRSA